MKKISVVIAAFNEEKTLPKCLDALTHQTFPRKDFEIIVVDNNSKDKTADIAQSFGAVVIKEKKQGNTFALSTGLKNATGEIIASTDADTIVSSNWLSVIYNAFKNENVVGLTGSANVNAGNPLFSMLGKKLYEYFLKFNFLIGKPSLTGFNFAVRRKAFDEIGGVDERFTMSPDVDLGLRLSKKGRILFLNNMEVLTSFRRWKEEPLEAFWVYFKGYFWTTWLRKPPPVKQSVIR